MRPEIVEFNNNQAETEQETCHPLDATLNKHLPETRKQNLASVSRLVLRGEPRRRVQQTKGGHSVDVLERGQF